jgi:Pyridoxamine 5'-phosphate oxidase
MAEPPRLIFVTIGGRPRMCRDSRPKRVGKRQRPAAPDPDLDHRPGEGVCTATAPGERLAGQYRRPPRERDLHAAATGMTADPARGVVRLYPARSRLRQPAVRGLSTLEVSSVSATIDRSGTQPTAGPVLTTERVWNELEKASFAVISYVTPGGKPRSSGVMCAAAGRHLYVATAADSWKARQISDGDQVAVTVPIRRGGLLSLIGPIPPATVSFHATATVHAAGSVSIESVSKKLASLLPKDRKSGCLLELVPEGSFLTYGLGVSLQDMAKPEAALAHVPATGLSRS